MSDDAEYLKKYKPDHLYTVPGPKGVYATIAGESEEVTGEIDVTSRCKLAVSAFHVHDSQDFGTFKITKLQFHKTYGWRPDSHIQVNQFQLAQIKEFLSIISSLDLSDAKKTRLSLDNLHVGALGTLLGSTKGAALISELAKSPELHQDIYAVAANLAPLHMRHRRLFLVEHHCAQKVHRRILASVEMLYEFARYVFPKRRPLVLLTPNVLALK
jgi:hypothetical protein